jgi:hypothetical protein
MCPPFSKRSLSVDNTQPFRRWHEPRILTCGIAVRDDHIRTVDDLDIHPQHAKLLVDVAFLKEHRVAGTDVEVGILMQRPTVWHDNLGPQVLNVQKSNIVMRDFLGVFVRKDTALEN